MRVASNAVDLALEHTSSIKWLKTVFKQYETMLLEIKRNEFIHSYLNAWGNFFSPQRLKISTPYNTERAVAVGEIATHLMQPCLDGVPHLLPRAAGPAGHPWAALWAPGWVLPLARSRRPEPVVDPTRAVSAGARLSPTVQPRNMHDKTLFHL